jgi:DeoR family fructose operon transcriptional repressor
MNLGLVSQPQAMVMVQDERRGKLLELVRQHGFASLLELSKTLNVSESTVRRDLDFLEESGSAKRTHGGVFYTGASPKLPHFEQRQAINWDKKRMIARSAAELIEDNDTVLLDGGSTTYELAQLLVGRPLHVVTNSLPVANLFMSSADTDLVVIGGYVHHRTGVVMGQHAHHMLAELNIRRAVLSVASVAEAGFYNNNLLIVETERAMMRAAEEVIVLADCTKFGHRSMAQLCPLSDVRKLVVDDGISDQWKTRIEDAGVQLIVAQSAEQHTSE